MSDPQTDSHSSSPVPVDPADVIRAEVQREYSAKLARAEVKVHAAQAGITLPDGFTDYLDTSKLLGEDGNPTTEAMDRALASFKFSEPPFPHVAGAGHNRSGGPIPERPRVSLDVRKR
ncbi:hypothetical protein ACFVZR_03035 [Streptomyces sp. NPDC058316]|uniref:hypothetical protein n=1 Tax=Streptomyces sp. NPDC058316 TaxID=3346442 RepID=UPI0036E7CF3D